MRKYRQIVLGLGVSFLMGITLPAAAQSILLRSDDTGVFSKFNWLPYAFFSESFGLGLGVGGGYTGWPEEPTTLLGAVTLGTSGSYNIALGASDLRFPGTQRLYMFPVVMVARYQDQQIWIGRRPEFPGERAGSNESSADNFAEATQWDNWGSFEFGYLLPIGHGRDNVIARYKTSRGLLLSGATGAETWNPMRSGRTHFKVTPKGRDQTLERENLEVPFDTFNVELALHYDNRDFPFNPSRGSYQEIAYTRDFMDEDRFGSWNLWTAEWGKYLDLGASDALRQRVIALNWWTAYVPTWETATVDGEEVVVKRPPWYEGANLGGLYRMRAYDDSRFQDKAAIFYSAEYRIIPEWQPLREVDWLNWADISFWQWVFFAEVGRVAPSWNISTLHSDMRYDGGIGLRGMVHTAVVRLDWALGEEGSRFVAMYGQPF